MEESSLSYKTLKNIGFSFVGYALPILFSVFVTPIVVIKLGVVDYGVYVLVNTITGFLLLLDLGLGTSLLKYTAEYHAKGDTENLQQLLNMGNLVFLLFGILGLLIFFVLGKFFLPLFHIVSTSQSHILVVFILSGILFFCNSSNMIFSYVSRALQRYDIGVGLSLAQLVIFNLLTLALVLMGLKLKAILVLNIITVVFLWMANRWYYKKLLPDFRLGYAWSGTQIRRVYKFGFAAFFTNLSGNALVQLDKLIIPIFLGTAPLTYYSLPGNVAQKVNGITGSSTGIFFPMITALQGLGDEEKIKDIYMKLFRNVTVFAAAMTVPIIFFANKILLFWLGAEFAKQGTVILVILAFTYFLLGIYGPLINFLLGLGKVKFLMRFSMVMAVINIILLLWWVPHYGILGAAYAYLVAVLPVGWIFYWVEKHFLNLTGRLKFYLLLYGKILVTSAIFAILYYAVIDRLTTNLAALIILGPVSVIMFAVIYKLLNFFPAEDWELYLSFLNSLKSKVKFLKRDKLT